MKAFLTLFFIFTVSCLSVAQNDSSSVRKDTLHHRANNEYKNVLSVSASSFIERMFKSNNTPDLNNSFLYYTRNFDKFFLRLGINGSNTKSTANNVKTTEQIISNRISSSASLGLYMRKNIGRGFIVAYGANIIAAHIDSSVTFVTPFDQVKNYAVSNHYGIAPGVLLQYRINKRISVFAEYTLPVKVIYSKTGTKYSLFPDENTTDRKTTSYSFQIYNPLSIYLSCSF